MNVGIKFLSNRNMFIASFFLFLFFAFGLTDLKKDTGIEAFVPKGSKALTMRHYVRERFGLHDPIVIALVGDTAGRALRNDVLELTRSWTAGLQGLSGINPDRVFSLATEEWVESVDDALISETLIPEGEITQASSAAVRRGLQAMPAYKGVLIAKDFSSVLLVAELREGAVEAAVYDAVAALVAESSLAEDLHVHVAGQATVSGYLDTYINTDRKLLIPAAILLMLVLVVLLVRSPVAGGIAVFIILGTLIATLGLMGWLGARYYVITSALPVVLVCIAVADTVHLITLTRRQEAAGLKPRDAVAAALHKLNPVIAATSITTASGFLGLAVMSDTVPISQFGYFAAFGVLVAWACTVLFTPILYRSLRRYRSNSRYTGEGLIPAAWIAIASVWLAHRSRTLLIGTFLVFMLSLLGLSQLVFNYERIRNFDEQSKVFIANAAINENFDGSYYLDTYLKSSAKNALLEPGNIRRVEELQQWMREQPEISDSFSYADIVRSVERAVIPAEENAAPLTAIDVEQLLFLYEISAKPGDLNQEITPGRGEALIRGYVKKDDFQRVAPVVDRLRAKSALIFDGSGITPTITGQVQVTSSWVAPLLWQTIGGALVVVALVGLCAAVMLRSAVQGLLCLLPVSFAVLSVYGLMGVLGIWLDVVTSMFASIVIGVGVDFCIYTQSAINKARNEGLFGAGLAQSVYREVIDPLTINAAVVALGFSILQLSSIPPLVNFGLLISVAILASWAAALLILPSVAALLSERLHRQTANAV